MAEADNVAVLQHFMDEVMGKGNVAAVDGLFTPGYVSHFPIPLPPGPEGIKAFVWGLRAGFPDFTVATGPLLAEGDQVACVWTMQGTQTGEFMGIPPTGKHARWVGIVITRFEAGKMAEKWGNFDQVSLLQQLGVIPTPA